MKMGGMSFREIIDGAVQQQQQRQPLSVLNPTATAFTPQSQKVQPAAVFSTTPLQPPPPGIPPFSFASTQTPYVPIGDASANLLGVEIALREGTKIESELYGGVIEDITGKRKDTAGDFLVL